MPFVETRSQSTQVTLRAVFSETTIEDIARREAGSAETGMYHI